MNRNRRFIFPFILVVGVCLPLWGQKKDDTFYDPNQDRRGANFEIDDIGRLLLGFRNQAYEDIAEELFDRVSTYDVGVPISDITTAIGQVRRKVYDNRDGTYTVLDLFGVKGIVAPAQTKNVAGVPLYAVVGSEVGADFINIRQYDHKLKIGYAPSVILPTDPWYQELWQGVKAQWFGLKPVFDVVNGTFNLLAGFFRSPSGEFMPRYENILDVISTPFRLPLSSQGFVRMDPGEIYSYTLTGGVFTSLGSGYVSGNLSSNVGISLFLRGASRLTVLKERNGNFAKIRRSLITSKGYSVSGKVKNKWDLEGVIFGSDLSFSITPFKVSIGKDKIHQWDQVYRYDMTTKEGRYAYEKAMIGNFIPTEVFALQGVGVEWLYDKDIKTKSHHFFHHYNLVIWRHQEDHPWGDSLISLRDAEGINHVFRSISRAEIESGNLFRSAEEKIDFFVETVMELDDPENSIHSINPIVQIVMFISDRHTYGYEIRKNLQMVEEIIQDGQFFEKGRYDPRKDYGKTDLELQIRFNLKAIDQILSASEDEIWMALAKAYGVSSKDWKTKEDRKKWTNWIHWIFALRSKKAQDRICVMAEARDILSYFQKIKTEEDRLKRASLLSKFHHDSAFQWKYLTAMLYLASEENIYYRVSFHGHGVFGKEKAWGDPMEIQRPDLHERDDEAFDGRENFVRATMTNLKFSKSSEAEPFILSFQTNIDPLEIEGFWFEINRMHIKWFRGENIYLTQNDRELFKGFEMDETGVVRVYLDRLKLQKPFEVGETYEVSFAFQQKNKIFSIQPTVKFKYQYQEELKIDWVDISGKSEFKD